jgi:uncharacterized protein YciI
MPRVKYVPQHLNADLSRVPARSPAHRARWQQLQAAGSLLRVRPSTPPAEVAAMGLFTSREAAEAFAAEDPFVLHGVVGRWSILEWNEASSVGQGTPTTRNHTPRQ